MFTLLPHAFAAPCLLAVALRRGLPCRLRSQPGRAGAAFTRACLPCPPPFLPTRLHPPLSCPWSKALWTDSVRALRRWLPASEIMELLGVMVDKGVRVAVPVVSPAAT